jgi:predicted nucleic acid-binding protein
MVTLKRSECRLRIYLDVSCLNRPFDDQSQVRIRLEAEAITMIFEEIDCGHWQQFSSEMVDIEVEAIRNEERLRRVVALLPERCDTIQLTEKIYGRAETLEHLGFKAADAVHVAAAEMGVVDVLLTCDDRMLNCARRLGQQLGVRVENPVDWLREQKDENYT